MRNLLERRMTKREFLGGVAALIAAGLGFTEIVHLIQEGQNPFENTPTLDLDFSKMPDGEPLNPAVWNYVEGVLAGHEAEQQAYSRSAVTVENGAVVITGSKQKTGEKDYRSGWIDTKEKFDILHGYVEAEMMLSGGVGPWDAFWIRATDTPHKDAATPAERSAPYFYIRDGEVDVLEHQATQNGVISSNVHTYESVSSKTNPNVGITNIPDASTAFHKYGIAWTPEYIAFLVDGHEYHRVALKPTDPFDHKFNIVINMALGGDWAEKLAKEQGLPFENGIDDSQQEKWKLRLRSLRYYPLKADHQG